jgi:DNA-binding beta-propeller fold protein YncE
MAQFGAGQYTYELVRDFLQLPNGESFGLISRVATDSQDRVYVFQRKDPPVVVFDRDGHYLGAWGRGEITDPHGLKIVNDIVYTTDRSDSVTKSFTLDGKVLLTLGTPGLHSDTGCTGSPWLALRAAEPFNHPTEMIAHPNGDIYVTDGYRNARVHRFTSDGVLVTSWGAPGTAKGEFHLPHSIAFDPDGKLYVADRANKRIQIFSPEGKFLGMWTGMGGPNDITRGKDGTFIIAEQEDSGNPAYVCVRDVEGTVIAKMESRHVHGVGVDSRGDIYAGLTVDRSVDKFVRTG